MEVTWNKFNMSEMKILQISYWFTMKIYILGTPFDTPMNTVRLTDKNIEQYHTTKWALEGKMSELSAQSCEWKKWVSKLYRLNKNAFFLQHSYIIWKCTNFLPRPLPVGKIYTIIWFLSLGSTWQLKIHE